MLRKAGMSRRTHRGFHLQDAMHWQQLHFTQCAVSHSSARFHLYDAIHWQQLHFTQCAVSHSSARFHLQDAMHWQQLHFTQCAVSHISAPQYSPCSTSPSCSWRWVPLSLSSGSSHPLVLGSPHTILWHCRTCLGRKPSPSDTTPAETQVLDVSVCYDSVTRATSFLTGYQKNLESIQQAVQSIYVLLLVKPFATVFGPLKESHNPWSVVATRALNSGGEHL